MKSYMRNTKCNIIVHCREYLAFTVTLCLLPALLYAAGNYTKTVAHYTVSSMGLSIGDVTTTHRLTEDSGVASIHFETKTAVKASFLWLGYHLETVEKGVLQKGNLVSYSRKGRENGADIDIEGRLEHSSFLFEVREQGGKHSIVIPRTSYDYTTMECPEAQLNFSGKTEVALRVLDVEKMAVVKRNYHLIQNTFYPVGGKELPCRVVDFSDKNKRARRWIMWDGSAVVLYRQDGTGEKNSYSLQATSVVKEM
jgi:hypothetical protein